MSSGTPPSVRRLPAFDLGPLPSLDDGSWLEGTHRSSGTRIIARVVDGITFADAFESINALLEVMEAPPPGILPPVGLALLAAGGAVVAASFSPDAPFEIPVDEMAAASVGPGQTVDVVVVWRASGDELLTRARSDPMAACQLVSEVAVMLDRVARESGDGLGHGALDGPCLRVIDGVPALLGTAMSRLAAVRRGRLDAAGPWQVVPADACPPRQSPGSHPDPYALAALWAHARTGRAPFGTGDPSGVVQLKQDGAAALDDLAPPERAVVTRALASLPAERFDTCVAFATALTEAISPPSHHPRPAEAPTPSSPTPTWAPMEGNNPAADEPPPDESPPPNPPTVPADSTSTSSPDEAAAGDAERVAIDETTTPDIRVRETVRATPVPTPRENRPYIAPPPPASPDPPTASQGTGSHQAPLAAYPYRSGDLIAPGYRLEVKLGEGNFGEVWRADRKGIKFAIKVIPRLGREGAKEFRAIQTVKNIRHAHIVAITDLWLKGPGPVILDDETVARVEELLRAGRGPDGEQASPLGDVPPPDQLELGIVMELGEETLAQRLAKRKALLGPDHPGGAGVEPQQLLEWMDQAAQAIDYFNMGHGTPGVGEGVTPPVGVQHCDIKPHNLLLLGGKIKVCDFGLARSQGDVVRATSTIHASVAYAAPEMTKRPQRPSPASDQYALAVTYHELRTGLLPYAGQTGRNPEELSAYAIQRAKETGDLDLSLVGPAEGSVLERALAVDPQGRYGGCKEMIDALRAAVRRDTERPRAAVELPRGLIGLTAGIVATVALVAGLWLWMRPWGEGREAARQKALSTAVDEIDSDDASPQQIDEVDRMIASGEPIPTSARKALADRVAAIRQRRADATLAEARDEFHAAVPDGERPLDNARLDKVLAIADEAAKYQPADNRSIEELRRGADAAKTIAGLLDAPGKSAVERVAPLRDAATVAFAADGAVPADIAARLEPRVAKPLADWQEENQDWSAVADEVVEIVKSMIARTKGGKSLDPLLLNRCADHLLRGEGHTAGDEVAAELAVKMARLGLHNLASREGQSPNNRAIIGVTLVEALVSAGKFSEATTEAKLLLELLEEMDDDVLLEFCRDKLAKLKTAHPDQLKELDVKAPIAGEVQGSGR